jgi:hypothetical protein
MTGISIVALIIAALLVMDAGADTGIATGLGPNWECHHLSYIRICKQITENSDKRPRAPCRARI